MVAIDAPLDLQIVISCSMITTDPPCTDALCTTTRELLDDFRHWREIDGFPGSLLLDGCAVLCAWVVVLFFLVVMSAMAVALLVLAFYAMGIVSLVMLRLAQESLSRLSS